MFGDISTGAHNDLTRATDIARSMVKEYGMSEKVGQVYFASKQKSQFLNVPGSESAGEYSEATAQLIDSEVQKIIAIQYEKAKKILKEREEVLIEGAEMLLKREKIDGDELKAITEAKGFAVASKA